MPEDQPSLVVVPVEVLQSLLQEVKQLKERVEALEGRAEGFDRWTGDYSEAFAYVAQKVKAIEASPSADKAPGRETAKRIAKLKEILKKRGGSQTFQRLQKDLDLSPSEFTYLVNHLDKRSFEVSRRLGSKRGEKILSLRVRIRDPVVFK
jgi:hypothetical protein